MLRFQRRVVARGVWLYDGTIRRSIEIRTTPVRFAGSRFVEDEGDAPAQAKTPDGFVLDETRPIPETAGGFVYSLSSGKRWPV